MLFSAEFVLTLCMIFLLAIALFELQIDGQQIRFGLRRKLGSNLRRCWQYRALAAVAVPFFLVLVSALWSTDIGYTLERLRIKLPFLVMPLAFISIPPFGKRELQVVLYFLLAIMTVACLYVGMNYLAHFDAVNDMIGRGKSMPTPSNHIRFSLALAFAVVAGASLWWDDFRLRYDWERRLTGGMTLFLFFFIHVLSVRSGILVLYLSLSYLAAWYVWRTRRYGYGLGAILLVLALPLITYQMAPSFRQKMNYMRWDLQQYLQGKGGDYSDSERLTSLEVGLQIGNEHPVLGVGAGDLKAEVNRLYATDFHGVYEPRMPHNQLISIYAGSGLVGLAVFLLAFFYPLFYRKNFRYPLLTAFYLLIFASFMMENTIENNFGVSFYVLFLLLGLNYLANRPSGL